MTIAEHLESKIKNAKLIFIISWLILVGMMHFDKSTQYFFYYIIPSIFIAGSGIYIFFFVKCPGCKTSLGQTAAYAGNFFQKNSKLNFCSNCGIYFKDEM